MANILAVKFLWICSRFLTHTSAGPMTVCAGVVDAIARVDYDTEDIVTDLMNRAEISLLEAGKRGGDAVVSLTSSKS